MVVIFVVCSRTPVARMVSVGGQDHRTENKRFGSFTSVGWLTTMPLCTPLAVHLRPQMEPFDLPPPPLSRRFARSFHQDEHLPTLQNVTRDMWRDTKLGILARLVGLVGTPPSSRAVR